MRIYFTTLHNIPKKKQRGRNQTWLYNGRANELIFILEWARCVCQFCYLFAYIKQEFPVVRNYLVRWTLPILDIKKCSVEIEPLFLILLLPWLISFTVVWRKSSFVKGTMKNISNGCGTITSKTKINNIFWNSFYTPGSPSETPSTWKNFKKCWF